MLNGCNAQSAAYTATDDGLISFGRWISTLKFCEDDTDSVYVGALASSVRYELQGTTIVFFNET